MEQIGASWGEVAVMIDFDDNEKVTGTIKIILYLIFDSHASLFKQLSKEAFDSKHIQIRESICPSLSPAHLCPCRWRE